MGMGNMTYHPAGLPAGRGTVQDVTSCDATVMQIGRGGAASDKSVSDSTVAKCI